jgi:hypothetical protein
MAGPGLAGQDARAQGPRAGLAGAEEEVLAFVQARPADGGAGALVVLLAPSARRI